MAMAFADKKRAQEDLSPSLRKKPGRLRAAQAWEIFPIMICGWKLVGAGWEQIFGAPA